MGTKSSVSPHWEEEVLSPATLETVNQEPPIRIVPIGLILLAPLILLVILAMLNYWTSRNYAQERAYAEIKMLSYQLATYQRFMLAPPTQSDGLTALSTRPTSGPNLTRWRKLMKSVPVDPWGNPYSYTFPAKRSTDPYDLYSLGPDRKVGTKDDIGNW